MNIDTLYLKNIKKSFVNKNIIQDVSINIKAGEIVALQGVSGSGKTTLLQIAGLIDKADSGTVECLGFEVNTLKDSEITLMRRKYIGYVYQFHFLLPEFSLLQNVAMPLILNGSSIEKAKKEAKSLLSELGLKNEFEENVSSLSGGERQRAAVCRAIIHKPKLIIADEPTGNLDAENASIVFARFRRLAIEEKSSILFATHDKKLAELADRVIKIDAGKASAT